VSAQSKTQTHAP